MAYKRSKIEVFGTVQGIGFRPFIYREAVKRGLKGHVFNHSKGVTIEVEGDEAVISDLLNTVRTSHPPFAQILSMTETEIEPKGDNCFCITESKGIECADTLISPDICVCEDCLKDISDPTNRRHLYPFTNCTNCGPRYTITGSVPYDRPFTTMRHVKMCAECEAEYNNPMDRRYHAQPNCCPKCGPSLLLLDANGGTIKGNDPIKNAIDSINNGGIVAIKGIGGFHLACDAMNDATVKKLRERKRRDEKPFAVMMPDIETIRKFCEVSAAEDALLSSPQRPIVLLRKKDGGLKVAESVAPENCYLGVMLPYTPLHHLLFTNAPTHQHTNALIMTSANISDEPICYENGDAVTRLNGIADYYLVHNRDILIRTDDSIARIMSGRPLTIRRSRGYTPQPIILKNTDTKVPHILAVGGELKMPPAFSKMEWRLSHNT